MNNEPALKLLSTLSKRVSQRIKSACFKYKRLPGLCLDMIISNDKDVIDQLSACLNDGDKSSFLFEHLKQHDVPKIKQVLKTKLFNQDHSQNQARFCAILRVCCGLSTFSNLCIFNTLEEWQQLDTLLDQQQSNKNRSCQLILCLCLLCMSQDQEITRLYLRQLVEKFYKADLCMESILLLATNFHAQLYGSIAWWNYNTAKLNPSHEVVQLNSDRMESLRGMFVDELIGVDVLANKILKIAPKVVVVTNTSDKWFVLRCINRMLKSKLFRTHHVDAGDWIFQQLHFSTDQMKTPSTMHKIIKELVLNCMPHPNHSFCM
ncbi:hypothetical protein AKO1_004123, partial [Acrasis kona]